jgi:hypothetical protein
MASKLPPAAFAKVATRVSNKPGALWPTLRPYLFAQATLLTFSVITLDGYLLDAPTPYGLWVALRQGLNRLLTLERGVFAALLIFTIFFPKAVFGLSVRISKNPQSHSDVLYPILLRGGILDFRSTVEGVTSQRPSVPKDGFNVVNGSRLIDSAIDRSGESDAVTIRANHPGEIYIIRRLHEVGESHVLAVETKSFFGNGFYGTGTNFSFLNLCYGVAVDAYRSSRGSEPAVFDLPSTLSNSPYRLNRGRPDSPKENRSAALNARVATFCAVLSSRWPRSQLLGDSEDNL